MKWTESTKPTSESVIPHAEPYFGFRREKTQTKELGYPILYTYKDGLSAAARINLKKAK